MYPSRAPLARGRGDGDTRICQRCEKPGHAIYECRNPRPYKSRPTRTQIFQNPQLEDRWRPSAAPPTEIRTYVRATHDTNLKPGASNLYFGGARAGARRRSIGTCFEYGPARCVSVRRDREHIGWIEKLVSFVPCAVLQHMQSQFCKRALTRAAVTTPTTVTVTVTSATTRSPLRLMLVSLLLSDYEPRRQLAARANGTLGRVQGV